MDHLAAICRYGLAKKPAKNTAKKAAVKAVRRGSGTGLLATGGGSAPAVGVTFQGWAGGLFAATGLTQASVDRRFQLKAESIAEFRFETESPIDDLIVYTTAPGRLFVQAKTNFSMAQSDSDAMMKTLDQIVRQWRLCTDGKKARRWDYPLDKEVDRFVIAVGTETPNTVAVHLSKALGRRREGGVRDATPKTQKNAMDAFAALLKRAWKAVYGIAATARQVTCGLRGLTRQPGEKRGTQPWRCWLAMYRSRLSSISQSCKRAQSIAVHGWNAAPTKALPTLNWRSS